MVVLSVRRNVATVEQLTEALEERLDVRDLSFGASDIPHERHQLLGEEDVVVPDEGHLVFHPINDSVDEFVFFKQILGILDNLLEVILLL